MYPTRAEEEAIKTIADRVSSSVDQESGIMTIWVTGGSSATAAQMADSFLAHLRERVRTIRTEKARQNVQFIEERFTEAKAELQQAEERLADFMDRNNNINSAQLRTEQDRLQRQVRFASDLYSELQTQLTQARIELQRSEPVITVVEKPVPPMERSAPMRFFIVLTSLVVGLIIGLGIAFFRVSITQAHEDRKAQHKIREIKQSLIPTFFRGGKPKGEAKG